MGNALVRWDLCAETNVELEDKELVSIVARGLINYSMTSISSH